MFNILVILVYSANASDSAADIRSPGRQMQPMYQVLSTGRPKILSWMVHMATYEILSFCNEYFRMKADL